MPAVDDSKGAYTRRHLIHLPTWVPLRFFRTTPLNATPHATKDNKRVRLILARLSPAHARRAAIFYSRGNIGSRWHTGCTLLRAFEVCTRSTTSGTARSFALTTTTQHARLRILFSVSVLPDMLTRALHRWRAGPARSTFHGCAAVDAPSAESLRARPADPLLLRQLQRGARWP